MFKATSVIQNLPCNDKNPMSTRFLILEDDATGAMTKISFKKGHYTTIYGDQMFDIYGREVEIDPEITEILEKAGHWVGYRPDFETYLVKKADGQTYLARVNYYYVDDGNRRDYPEYLPDCNPLFCRGTNLQVELNCSNVQVLDRQVFPELLTRSGRRSRQQLDFWLVRDDRFFLLRPEEISKMFFCVFEKKSDHRATWSGGKGFLEFSNLNGKISAKIRTSSNEILTIGTDAQFITKKRRESVYYTGVELPFYLLNKDPA